MRFNETQQKIVNNINGPLLCIAGPGSGKTTSIIGRVANMVAQGIAPNRILIVTFTKAAADEMKERYLKMEGAVDGPTFGTIHSLCFRILRKFDPERYTRESVLTEQEQRQFIRNEIKGMRIERVDQDAIINAILAAIANVKNNSLSPKNIDVEGCTPDQFYNIYINYEKFKKNENKIDYDDMLFVADEIFHDHPDVLRMWRNTFSHFIVDEFQDTNILQSKIIYNMAYPKNNICVVGDDDQCQPAGTVILLPNNEEKNIEDIVVGDKLMNCNNPNIDGVRENIVLDVAKREYKGTMVTIGWGFRMHSSYTANHRTFVKFNFNEKKFAICLREDKKHRINYAKVKFTADEFERLKNENNKFWLISVHNSEAEALAKLDNMIDESILSRSQNVLFVKNNRDYAYPMCSNEGWQKNISFKRDVVVEIYAQNLMPWNMSAVANLEQEYNLSKERYQIIESVDFNTLDNPVTVYSLKTSTETYVADDLVTHNCIYRFRGAVPQIMLNFEKQFPNCEKVILNVNYRSEPAIVETSKRLIENNEVRFEKPLAASKVGDATITYDVYRNRDKEIAQIIKQIKFKQRKGEPLDEVAILYRTNNQAAQITQACIKADIPFYTNEMVVNIYDHWIFNDFKNFKKVADGNCTINEFLSIINRPNKYIARKLLPEYYSEEAIMKCLNRIPESWKREKMKETLDDWFFWINKMSSMKPAEFIVTIRRNLEYDKYVKTYSETNKFDESQFIDIMDEIQDAAESFETFEEWYAFIEKELREFKEKMKEKKKENSVVLSTMHRAKGLEWDEVYIVDCNEDIVPYYKATEQEDIEEERRMFYVAVTRARKILHICSIEKRNKTPMYLSRFVKEMKPPVEITHTVDQGFKAPTTTVQFKPSMWVFHKTFGSGMITRVADGKIYIAFSDAGLKILEEKWCVANLQLF